jgi:transcription-repair coupling factor (superfamily II helicase)
MTDAALTTREAADAPTETRRSLGAQAIRLADAVRKAGRKGVIHLAKDNREAEGIAALARRLAPDVAVLALPAWDSLPYDGASPSRECMGRRMQALHALAAGQSAPWLLVATIEAVLQRLPPRELWQDEPVMMLRVGDPFDALALEEFFRRSGYVFDDRVDDPGEAALRGQVADIFPAGADQPVRIDFDEGRITQICPFDPLSQRTTDVDLDHILLLPASEIVLGPDTAEERFAGAEHSLGKFYAALETIFDYAPEAALSGARLEERRRVAWEQIREAYDAHREVPLSAHDEPPRPVPAPEALYLDETSWQAAVKGRRSLELQPDAAPVPRFAGKRAATASANAYIRDETAEGRKVVLACEDDRQRRMVLRRMEKSLGRPIDPAEDWAGVRSGPAGAVFSMLLPVEQGFALPEEDVTVIAGSEILGQSARPERQRSLSALSIAQAEFDIGDTVIHLDHGMAVLRGLEVIEAAGQTCEMVRLEYADEATLMVPSDEVGAIWRYGSDREAVTLDRLNSEAWQKRRTKVEAEIAGTADRLLALSTARAKAKATPFVRTADYERFLARFPYSESPDQAAAIAEVLDDLASGRPMDRLVCGDVGFGKTEVALRAAAVVAMAGAQVAVIAPTTVLARQHAQNFARRFAGFGIEVAQLSRLTKSAEAREVKQRLAEGAVRIVVGTHAIAAKDVRFKNLGLLIIDEEQRLGARDKDKLRARGKGSHVLTLTATPIPRTLQSAVVGIQDLSVIATPPVRRRPIRTILTPFDPALIGQAMLRERGRGGQTFVVCPRVEDIAPMAERLREIAPGLRLLCAHGKMPAAEIDDAMMRFAAGKADVLLATNIIESGLDLPSANTMLVWRPDRFGLSQLHQLRGRVGRGRRRGVAYLVTPPDMKLAPATEKRLRTLEALDRLGAGFEISARDLDARGAGDLLGEDQAGHINLIGTDLYRRLLGRALARARGEEPEPEWTPDINLGASAFIPQDYVPEPEVRLNLHARLARLASLDEVEAFSEELEDRFGPPPDTVDGLLVRAQTAIFCREMGIAKVEAGPKGIAIAFRAGSAASATGKRLVVAKETEPGAERHAVVLSLLRKLQSGELRPRKRSRSRAGLGEERAMVSG